MRVGPPVAVAVGGEQAPGAREELHRADGPVVGLVEVQRPAVGVADDRRPGQRPVQPGAEDHPPGRAGWVDPATGGLPRLDPADTGQEPPRQAAPGVAALQRVGRPAVGVEDQRGDAAGERGPAQQLGGHGRAQPGRIGAGAVQAGDGRAGAGLVGPHPRVGHREEHAGALPGTGPRRARRRGETTDSWVRPPWPWSRVMAGTATSEAAATPARPARPRTRRAWRARRRSRKRTTRGWTGGCGSLEPMPSPLASVP